MVTVVCNLLNLSLNNVHVCISVLPTGQQTRLALTQITLSFVDQSKCFMFLLCWISRAVLQC